MAGSTPVRRSSSAPSRTPARKPSTPARSNSSTPARSSAPSRSSSPAASRAAGNSAATGSTNAPARTASTGSPAAPEKSTQAAQARAAEAAPAQSPEKKTQAPSTETKVTVSDEARQAGKAPSAESKQHVDALKNNFGELQEQAKGMKLSDPGYSDNYRQRMEQIESQFKSGKMSKEDYENGIKSMYGEALQKYRTHQVDSENSYQTEMKGRRADISKGKQEIDGIVGIKDDALRNAKITQKYSELSEDMRKMLGPDAGANWSTWATWASKQAGQTIRQEDLGTAGKVIGTALDWGAGGLLGKLGKGQYDDVSKTIAGGNRKVFQEIAPEFNRFIGTFKGDTAPNQRKFDEFAQGFGPQQGGLKDAFSNYYKAMFEKDANKKQELMFMGNAQIGMHEQRRLQPDIAAGMPMMRETLTNNMMSIGLPNERLNLGSDVPKWGSMEFPRSLQTIENPDLNNMVNKVDANPSTLQGSGAKDWSNFDQRMNYIMDLFRSRHMDPSLFQAPFDADQTRALQAGQMPGGQL